MANFEVNLADLTSSAQLLRHSDAVAAAFAHSQGRGLHEETLLS